MKNNALLYERMHLGEIHITDESAAAVKKLAESDRAILSLYPAASMEQAVLRKRFQTVNEQRPSAKQTGRKRMFFTVCIPAAAAAVLIAFISVGNVSKTVVSDTAAANTSTIRVKGVAQNTLRLYKQNADGITRLKNKDHAAEGDLIQISYIADSGYGAIFSIDGNGTITRHFPDTDTSAQLTEGKEIPLDFSYKLDGAPEFERFVFVTSQTPFSVRQITAALRSKKTADIMTADLTAFMPPNASVSDVLILK